MKITRNIVVAAICLTYAFCAYAQEKLPIHIYYASLDSAKARPVKEYMFKDYSGEISWGHDIEVIPEVTYQTLEGIGGAFNEIGGEALLSLNKTQQQTLMDNLFNNENAGFTLCRTALGASDFSIYF